MIYFIKKTVSDNDEAKVEFQQFSSFENCTKMINANKAIVPNYIVSSTMAVYDIKYDEAVIMITNDKNLPIVADILMNGIKGNRKTDDFVLATIESIHSDKIRSISKKPSLFQNKTLIRDLINKCRDECLMSCANGVSPSKKISLAFFELKCALGINITSTNV